MGCKYLYKGTWYTEDELRELFSQRGVTSREMVFLRHGITDEDDAGENSGQNRETINEKGYKETKESLEKDLGSQAIEVVYSSPTKRAKQTSQIISKDLNIPIIEIAGLEAWDLGKFAGHPEGEFDERFYLNNPDVKVPGGESFNQFKDRLMDAMDQIQHSAKKPAILTHSKSLKVLQALDKTGGIWNKEAIKEYFKESDPENKQVNKINYYTSDDPLRRNINPSQASASTMKKVKEFLDRIGVEVQSLAKITYDGQSLGVNGLADPLNGLIQVAQGKEDIALPEEAMHMAVELIEQKNPKLFREMMDRIGRYNLTDQVFAEYQNNPFYQKDDKADINKIKKEAIGKVLAQTVIDRNQGAQEKPELLNQTRSWWQRIIDFLKDLFLRAGFNPFEEVAEKVLGGEDFGTVEELEGSPFLQTPQGIVDQIIQKNINITKRGDEFEINGNKIRKSIQEQIQDFYRKRIGAERADKALRGFKQETENKIQVDIKDIFNRFIDDDNKVRITPLAQTNPSAVDPMDNSFYLTLESHIKERLDSYEPGTQFVHSVNLYDGLNTAGHADLIAITPQGKVDILQFKVPQYATTSPDVPVYRQEAYNLEIEALRKILQTGYGVNRSDFRQTRAIPIKAEYERLAPGISDMKLIKLVIGNVNVSLIKDDALLPISSESEVSENEQFDEFIRRLRALAQKIASERVSPDKRQERSARVAELLAAIRRLQIKRDGSGLVRSGQALIKRSKERVSALRDKVANTDPDQATVAELNKIADDILSDKDQIEIYKDMYSIFKNTFTDGTVDSQDMVKDARNISDDANDMINDYWNLAVKFRTTKFAAKVGIKDEFTPEKRLTWYRRMIRSLSQSSIKAGAELWELVKRINNGFKLEFLDRLDELGKIEKNVSEWMKDKPVQDLYKKIFQYDDKGRWTGKVIQKIDRKFYEDLKKAQENRDEKWVKANIDVDAYKVWFVEQHQRRIDESKTARIVADDAENARLVQQGLQDFVDTFHIDFKKGVGTYNWALKNFPKVDNWKSDAYKEIENIKPLLDLYEYYVKRLKESWDLGMLHEHNGWSWFPNVRRNLLEKLSTAPAGGKLQSLFGSVRIEAEDQEFGKIDPITGKPVDEIHANFVSDLFQYVQDADGNYFRDYSEKSMDVFKVIALWDAEIVKYKLRTESEAMARLLHYTELGRKAYESTTTGKLKKTPEGRPLPISNEVNAQYVKEHIDAVYYGKAKSDEFDVAITIPYKSAVEKINKLFGSEILTVPEKSEIKISGIKAIGVMNRYFVTKTLGLNVMTSIAQLFGGTINTAINQGLYFNKKDMLEAELKYVSSKFYGSDQDKKFAALVGFFHPYLEDRTSAEIRKMSVSKMVEYLSSDHLFYLQRGSDNWVNTIVALAMFKNTMVDNGKLVNIRDFARKELGHANKYQGGYEGSVEFDKRLEKRVEELQNSPQALVNYAQVVNDQITLPNIDRNGDQIINLRQQILEIIKDALGNTSHEDLSLYKRSVMWQSFFMFKNWIPRMFDVRFGSLKYSPGTNKYEYGRVRMLANAVTHLGLSANASLIAKLGNNPKPLIEVAKEQYSKKRAAFAEEMQDFEMTEAEFVDMYIKGVRSEMKELILAAGLMGILIAMRLSAPDRDDDEHTKGAYRWSLRALDKLTDELTFMYTPSSFTNILNGSVFPAVGILVEAERLFTSVIKKLFFFMTGNEEAAGRQHPSKYVFRMLPITKEIINYLAVFNNDIAKEYGIRMNTNYGSVR